jgi:hypothetical protein
VFVGTAVALDPAGYRFRVDEAFRGIAAETRDVLLLAPSGSFMLGHQYLFFSSAVVPHPRWPAETRLLPCGQ